MDIVEFKRLIGKQKAGRALTSQEQAAWAAMNAEWSLWLLAVIAHQGNFRTPYPALTVPRDQAPAWCLVPIPTIEVERVKVERRKGKSPIRHHTLERRISPKSRSAWAAMCRRQVEIEARIGQGHQVSADESMFTRFAGLAQKWFEWERKSSKKKPLIPPVIPIRREEAPMWVLIPAGGPR